MHEIFWPYSRKENLFGHHVLFDHFTKGWFIWITVEPVPYGHLSNTGTSKLRSHKFFLPSKMAIHKKNLLMQSLVNLANGPILKSQTVESFIISPR